MTLLPLFRLCAAAAGPAPGRLPAAALYALAGLFWAPDLAASQAADPAKLRQACDGPGHATVLRADTTAHPAQAVWLDARRLQWPGAAQAGRYRLLQAAAGGIDATPGQPARGADQVLVLQALAGPLPPEVLLRHRHLADGARLALPATATPAQLQALHRGQLLLVQEDEAGRVLQATGVQAAAALDDLYAPAEALSDLGVTFSGQHTRLRLWAPTAQAVHLCLHASDTAPAQPDVPALQRDSATGSWQLQLPGRPAARYARYLVDVWVPGTGPVRQRMTDP